MFERRNGADQPADVNAVVVVSIVGQEAHPCSFRLDRGDLDIRRLRCVVRAVPEPGCVCGPGIDKNAVRARVEMKPQTVPVDVNRQQYPSGLRREHRGNMLRPLSLNREDVDDEHWNASIAVLPFGQGPCGVADDAFARSDIFRYDRSRTGERAVADRARSNDRGI